MTSEQINKAIALECGWTCPNCGMDASKCSGCDFEDYPNRCIPHYCSDLNDMHEAWCSLSEDQHKLFRYCLQRIVIRDGHNCGPCISVCNAIAIQRAEAFLRAKGKWTE
jgi:hypothetical protein